MGFDERVIDSDDLDGAVLNTAGIISLALLLPGQKAGTVGYVRIAEDDTSNATEAIDTDESL